MYRHSGTFERASTAVHCLLRTATVVAIGASLATTAAAVDATNAGDVARGEYLATIMVCADCHSGRLADGRIDEAFFLAGGTPGFEIPGMGVFWPPNLTPDPATGLGDWTDPEIAAAIRDGVRPDGRVLAPIMPYAFYQVLTDTDMADLLAYLQVRAAGRARRAGARGCRGRRHGSLLRGHRAGGRAVGSASAATAGLQGPGGGGIRWEECLDRELGQGQVERRAEHRGRADEGSALGQPSSSLESRPWPSSPSCSSSAGAAPIARARSRPHAPDGA